jgi:hypothetical protein
MEVAANVPQATLLSERHSLGADANFNSSCPATTLLIIESFWHNHACSHIVAVATNPHIATRTFVRFAAAEPH